MVDNNDTLIREVDEELRREQLAKLWERYGVLAIGAAVALVLGVAGYKWNQARTLSNAQTAGARFEAATNLQAENKPDEAIRAFEAIEKDGPAGYATLAGIREASALASSGKPAEAIAAYDGVAKSSTDALLRDFARLQAASLRLGTADWTEMQNRLNDLASDSSAWRFSARELLGLAALRAGKIAEAREALEKLIGDPKVPTAVGQRAQVLMSQVASAEIASGKVKDAAGPATPAGPADAKDVKSEGATAPAKDAK